MRVVRGRDKYKNVQNLVLKIFSRTERRRGVGRVSVCQLALRLCFAFAEEMRAELLDVRGCDSSDPKHLFSGEQPHLL